MNPTQITRPQIRTPLGRLLTVAAASGALALAACADRDEVDTTAQSSAQAEEGMAYAAATDRPTGSGATGTAPASAAGAADARAAQDPSEANRASGTNQSVQSQAQPEARDSARITLQEEELEIEKQQESAGGVLVKTDVETERVQRPVELQHEEAQVERLSAEEARQLQAETTASGAQQISEDEVFVPLTREKAVVEKDVETTGGIEVTTSEQTREETVDATLRKEVADVERQGMAQSGQNQDGTQSGSSYAASGQGQNPQGLEQRIRQELRSAQDVNLDQQQIDALEIQVEGDRVVLSGTVPNQQSADRIEQRISDLEGVQSVDNQLQPQDQPMQAAE